jgi:IMP dehydrogenase
VEKLLVVDDQYNLKGLITVKDIQKKLKYPNAAKDPQGRLRVGAAIGSYGRFSGTRAGAGAPESGRAGVDSAHGHSSRVMEAVGRSRKRFPKSI